MLRRVYFQRPVFKASFAGDPANILVIRPISRVSHDANEVRPRALNIDIEWRGS